MYWKNQRRRRRRLVKQFSFEFLTLVSSMNMIIKMDFSADGEWRVGDKSIGVGDHVY